MELGSMTDPKPLASLSPTLLARKGGARPAMRSQLNAMNHLEATARNFEDLGFNDMGEDAPESFQTADIVDINGGAAHTGSQIPEVLRQQDAIAQELARNARPRRSALADGRSAAFTLRLDAERHLRLRLACTLINRSAQQLVTEALDRMIADLPEVADLASRASRRR